MYYFGLRIKKKEILNINKLFIIFLYTNILEILLLNIKKNCYNFDMKFY